MSKNKRTLFKGFSIGFVLVLAFAALASCKPSPAEGPESTERPRYDVGVYGDLESLDPRGQVVVLWHPFTQEREELLLALVDEFNVTNEWGITVLGEYGGSIDELYERVSSRVGSGALPSIAIVERHHLASYVSQDALIALDPYLESSTWGYTQAELDDFLPVALVGGRLPQFSGRYGWPLYLDAEVVYYNEDWLVDLGYTGPPGTWEAFEEVACAASDPAAGTYGYEFSVRAFTFADMLLNRHEPMLDQDAGTYVFDGSEGLETLTFIQDLIGGDCAVIETEMSGALDDFGDGAVLLTIGNVSDVPRYRDAVAEGAGFGWSISPLPNTWYTPTIAFQGPSFAMFDSAPEKQLATWLFLRSFAEPDGQARWAQALGTFPVRRSSVGAMEAYLVENPRYEKALGFLAFDAFVEPGVLGYGTCRDAIEGMLEAVARRGDPRAWLANTVDVCNASLR